MRNPYYSLEAILRLAIPSVCTSGVWTRPAFAIVLDGEELIPEKIITVEVLVDYNNCTTTNKTGGWFYVFCMTSKSLFQLDQLNASYVF